MATRRRLHSAAYEDKTNWYDTHPTYAERLSAVAGLPDSSEPLETASASELLAEPEGIERELTRLLTWQLSSHAGVVGSAPYGRNRTEKQSAKSQAIPAEMSMACPWCEELVFPTNDGFCPACNRPIA